MVIKQFQTCVFFNKQNSQFTFQQILQQVHVLVNHSLTSIKKNQKQTRDNIYMSYDTPKKKNNNTDDCNRQNSIWIDCCFNKTCEFGHTLTG